MWEDNIKIYLKEMSWEGVDWINLALDRDHWKVFMNMIVNLIMNLPVS
jgi:hypothetical protein